MSPRPLSGSPGSRGSVTLLPRRLIDASVVSGVWKRLVFGHPARTDGLVDRNAYVFCVLEGFRRHLRRREIYAPASSRWRDPNAALLDGLAWEAVVSGTDRDCLHAWDVVFASGEGRRADVIVTDTGTYSDLVFGLAHLTDSSTGRRWPIYRIGSCGGW